jgi:hypothetical protein
VSVHSALTPTVAALAAAGTLVSCSSATNMSTTPSPLNPQSKEALERSAHELDVRAVRRDDAKAWDYYSQRCKGQIGSLENYSTVLDEFFRGRAPQFEGVTANVRGSSAQVVSIDKDPKCARERDAAKDVDVHRRKVAIRQLLKKRHKSARHLPLSGFRCGDG